MRRKTREISIFNMSALDLFASALGAFIVITVVLFPYYLKNNEVVSQLNQAKAELAQAKQQLARTFLAVVMKWPTEKHDIDLHVITPAGNEFYYKKNNRSRADYPASTAELSVDTIRGAGIEIWEQPNAAVGTYKIYYKFYARHSGVNKTTLTGNIYYRNGMKKLPSITLNRQGEKKLVALVILDDQGEVHIQ